MSNCCIIHGWLLQEKFIITFFSIFFLLIVFLILKSTNSSLQISKSENLIKACRVYTFELVFRFITGRHSQVCRQNASDRFHIRQSSIAFTMLCQSSFADIRKLISLSPWATSEQTTYLPRRSCECVNLGIEVSPNYCLKLIKYLYFDINCWLDGDTVKFYIL